MTGPSGVGKGTLIKRLKELVPGLRLSISATTRQPRPGEVDGVHYHFLTPESFQQRIDDQLFIEHADYAGNRYGTLRSEIDRSSSDSSAILLEIELQGARQIRKTVPDAVQIFIAPPSFEALKSRLTGRGTDSQEQIQRRLVLAKEEMAAASEFEHVIENDSLELAAAELAKLVSDSVAGSSLP